MANPLIPQEIYLLERYSSAEYFKLLWDAFAATVQAAEDGLAEVMRTLPPDYRRRPRWQQPDITWGTVVLPNFRDTLQMVEEAYLALLGGECSAIGIAGNVNTAFAGQGRDFPYDWMPEPFASKFSEYGRLARRYARNIAFTDQIGWNVGALSARYNVDSRGPLAPPPRGRSTASTPSYASPPMKKSRSPASICPMLTRPVPSSFVPEPTPPKCPSDTTPRPGKTSAMSTPSGPWSNASRTVAAAPEAARTTRVVPRPVSPTFPPANPAPKPAGGSLRPRQIHGATSNKETPCPMWAAITARPTGNGHRINRRRNCRVGFIPPTSTQAGRIWPYRSAVGPDRHLKDNA